MLALADVSLSRRGGGAGGIADGFEVFDHLGGDAEAFLEDRIGNPLEVLGSRYVANLLRLLLQTYLEEAGEPAGSPTAFARFRRCAGRKGEAKLRRGPLDRVKIAVIDLIFCLGIGVAGAGSSSGGNQGERAGYEKQIREPYCFGCLRLCCMRRLKRASVEAAGGLVSGAPRRGSFGGMEPETAARDCRSNLGVRIQQGRASDDAVGTGAIQSGGTFVWAA